MSDDLYYGPPDADRHCARQYKKAGYRCPNHIDFYVKIPDGRDGDWRKAWASCAEHLPVVIWQMQEAYGGEARYDGDYLLRANVIA